MRARAAEPVTDHAAERRFYAADRAIGRLGMRVFRPQIMDRHHWHGHVELNLYPGAMTYDVGGEPVVIPPGRVVVFWAGVPHRLVAVDSQDGSRGEGGAEARLTNLYLPLDRFLFMRHLSNLQATLLAGGFVLLDPALGAAGLMERWYLDYRSGDPERREVMLMEVNALLRRAQMGAPDLARPPAGRGEVARPSPARTAHVVAMLRHMVEHLSEPLSNADIARVTGLHETYASSLFGQVIGTPMRRFVIRMRLLQARALLSDSDAPVASVALQSGFQSPSQFHAHFRRAFGTTPQAIRAGPGGP